MCGGLFVACEENDSGSYTYKEIVRGSKDLSDTEEAEKREAAEEGETKNDSKEEEEEKEEAEEGALYAEFYVGGERIRKIPLINGQLADEEPNVPQKRGYTGKWEECGSETGKNVLYRAAYSPVEYIIDYHINRGDNAEENPGTYTVETPSFTFAEPTRRGYAFCGWYTDETYTVKIDGVAENSTGNLELYARWNLVEYTIVYETDGGKNAAENPLFYTVESETSALLPAEKEGFEFVGWFENGKQISEISAGKTGNLVLTAQWRAAEKYVFSAKGGELKENVLYFVFAADDTSLSVAERIVYSSGCSGKIFRAEDVENIETTAEEDESKTGSGSEIDVLSESDLLNGENLFYLIVQKEGSKTVQTYLLYVYKQYYVTVTYYYDTICLGSAQTLAGEAFFPSCDTSEIAGEVRGWKFGNGARRGEEISVGEEVALTEDTALYAVIQ